MDSRGRTRYRVRFRRQGTPGISRTFHTLEAARRFLAQTEREHELGTLGVRSGERVTLGHTIQRYLGSPEFAGKADKTQIQQRQQLGWWESRHGALYLGALTQAWLSSRRDEMGRDRSPATVRGYFAPLRRLLRLASGEWQLLPQNPASGLRMPKADKGRIRYLSDDERQRLLAACQSSEREPFLHTLVLLALATGCRKSEALGLTWSDIDFAKSVVVFRDTKNGESRTVPLSAVAADALREHQRHHRVVGVEWVFGKRRSARPPTLSYRYWKAAREQARIDDFRFHDLRHSAASYLAMSGAGLLEIAEILGHKNIAQTQRYAHLSQGHLAEVVNRMAEQRFSTGRAINPG